MNPERPPRMKRLSTRVGMAVALTLLLGFGCFTAASAYLGLQTGMRHAEMACQDWAAAVRVGLQAVLEAQESSVEKDRAIGEYLERHRAQGKTMGLQVFDSYGLHK